MFRNILCFVLAGLLMWLFIWAPNFTHETAELLDAMANRAIAAASAGRWEEYEITADTLVRELDSRKIGLKILHDHEDVDALLRSAAVAAAMAKQKSAVDVIVELAGFRAALEYVRDIDRLLWVNIL